MKGLGKIGDSVKILLDAESLLFTDQPTEKPAEE